MPGKDLTPVPWSAPALERLWRLEHLWTCGCGLAHDRDVNAARNLLEAMNLQRRAA